MSNVNAKKVVADLSETQRITLRKNSDSVTLQKEWRKHGSNDWAIGKGIEVPNSHIPDLIESLQVG